LPLTCTGVLVVVANLLGYMCHYSAADVVAKLTPSLPEGFVQDKDAFVAALREAAVGFFGPPGECIESYTTKASAKEGESSPTERCFEIYECKMEDNEPAQKLLTNLQTLSLWFIEGEASCGFQQNEYV
jgi:hypothetical protein